MEEIEGKGGGREGGRGEGRERERGRGREGEGEGERKREVSIGRKSCISRTVHCIIKSKSILHYFQRRVYSLGPMNFQLNTMWEVHVNKRRLHTS